MPGDTLYDRGQGFKLGTVLPRKRQVHVCTHMPSFHMQLKLHNSADRGIYKSLYLRLRLVVCFYPRPSAWHWLPWVLSAFASLTVIFEISLDPFISIVTIL